MAKAAETPARLQYLTITLTTRCNFACAHCYGDYGRKGNDMALSHALHCMDLAAKHNADIILTGGEPTLYRGLLACIEKAAALGLYMALSSNGSFKLERLKDMKRAGLRELHICYEKYHAPFTSPDRVKLIIDTAVALDIRPVLGIIEANSYDKYLAVFGDYYRFCEHGGHTFKPLVCAGRAMRLHRSEFMSDELLPVGKTHQFTVWVTPQGQVAFCPVNHCFASAVVDLSSDWLDGIVDIFSRDSIVKILISEGVSGLLRRTTGIDSDDWCSPFYECNLCMEATQRI